MSGNWIECPKADATHVLHRGTVKPILQVQNDAFILVPGIDVGAETVSWAACQKWLKDKPMTPIDGASPRPWQVWQDHPLVFSGEITKNTPSNMSGKFVQVCDCENYNSLDQETMAANAALIVQAVNAYDAQSALIAELTARLASAERALADAIKLDGMKCRISTGGLEWIQRFSGGVIVESSAENYPDLANHLREMTEKTKEENQK